MEEEPPGADELLEDGLPEEEEPPGADELPEDGLLEEEPPGPVVPSLTTVVAQEFPGVVVVVLGLAVCFHSRCLRHLNQSYEKRHRWCRVLLAAILPESDGFK